MSEANNVAAVKAAIPFLQELGLIEPCKDCPSVKAAVKELQHLGRNVSLHAAAADAASGNQRYANVKIVDGFRMYCSKCKGFDFVPTKRGFQLIGFVKLWFDDCDNVDFTDAQEIPF